MRACTRSQTSRRGQRHPRDCRTPAGSLGFCRAPIRGEGNVTDFDSPQAADHGQGSGPEDGYRQTPAQLSAQIRVLNDEVAQLRRRLATVPSDTRPLERQLTESANRINALVRTEREARRHAARRACPTAAAEGRSRPTRPAAQRLRRLPQLRAGRFGRGVHRRPQDAAGGVADSRGRDAATADSRSA